VNYCCLSGFVLSHLSATWGWLRDGTDAFTKMELLHCGPSSGAPAWQVEGPQFKPQYSKPKKKKMELEFKMRLRFPHGMLRTFGKAQNYNKSQV
jgi:hypothetical protein